MENLERIPVQEDFRSERLWQKVLHGAVAPPAPAQACWTEEH